MQIEAIALYHRDGSRKRILKLSPGLNLISGWRNTGKSSLLNIIEYCLGKDEFEVAHGPIRDSVAWYGLVLRHRGRFAFAGRPKPRGGAASTSDAMWLPLTDAQPPAADQLAPNATTNALRGQLSAFSEFLEFRFDPPADAFREPLHLHVGHVLPACLQDDDDIDSKHLFHRDREREVIQALRDALPYWLGAANENAPRLRFRLTEVKREMSHARRSLQRLIDAKSEADTRGLTLFQQAAEAGIAERTNSDDLPSGDDLAHLLRRAADTDTASPGALAPSGEVERLLSERRDLHERLAKAERDEALLRAFGSDRQAFSRETDEQRARLSSIGLIRHDGDASVCPVCSQALEAEDQSAGELASQLEQLNAELNSVSDLEPRDRRALEDAISHTKQVQRELQSVNSSLRDISGRDRKAAETRDLAAKQAFVQGRITEYLRTLAVDDPLAEERLLEQITKLEAEEADLAKRIDSEGEQERLEGAINLIGVKTTASVRALSPVRAAGNQVRLDLGKMTLMIDVGQETFPLSGLGGAGTRVEYHLAAHFALHQLLRERKRPGPAFLVLDQPTGPFYPENTPSGVEPKLEKEDDRTVVAGLFEFIRTSTDELETELQVLVLDHYSAAGEAWFDDALIGNWRNGQGLLPSDWL